MGFNGGEGKGGEIYQLNICFDSNDGREREGRDFNTKLLFYPSNLKTIT